MVKNPYAKLLKSEKAFTPTPTFRKQHSCASTTHSKSGCRGFTLIELLVVVAIIGILSSVVIASLNGARERGKIATIKSTLKQLYNQAALNQLESGSFTGSYTSYTDLTCTGPGGNLAKIVQPLIDQGITVKCYSHNSSTYNDVYQRFGATALIYDTNELKAWSVDENGVVKWDTRGVNSSGDYITPDTSTGMTWAVSNYACAKSGGRLPSLEQLRTLSLAWYSASLSSTGTGSYNPTSLYTPENWYWSSTLVPSSPSSLSYIEYMGNGSWSYSNQNVGYFVRCVR